MHVEWNRPALADAVVWVALALLGWITWSVVQEAIRARSAPVLRSGIEDGIDRLDGLRQGFPSGMTIGYASPYDQTDSRFMARLGLARYALTPVILDASDRHRFVVADFDTPSELAAYVRAVQGTVRRNADLGLALVERPMSSAR